MPHANQSSVYVAVCLAIGMGCSSSNDTGLATSDAGFLDTGSGGLKSGSGGTIVGAGGVVAGAGGAQAGGTGGASGQCKFNNPDPTCNSCVQTACLKECAACSAEPDCPKLYECVWDCNNSSECETQCQKQYSKGQDELLAFVGSQGCVSAKCSAACSGQGGAGGGGAGGSGSGTGGVGGSVSGAGGAAADPYESARQLCVDKSNEFRASLGLAALVRHKAKETCVDAEAQEYALTGIAHAGAKCNEYYQNECAFVSAPAKSAASTCIDLYIKEGPSSSLNHYEILTSPQMTKVACGFYEAGGQVWMAQDFW